MYHTVMTLLRVGRFAGALSLHTAWSGPAIDRQHSPSRRAHSVPRFIGALEEKFTAFNWRQPAGPAFERAPLLGTVHLCFRPTGRLD